MNTHADKASETKSTSMANGSPKRQPNGRSAVHLADNRSEATALMKMQELANDSPHASRLRALQQLANNSPQVSQLRSLQQLANNSPQAKQVSQFQALADAASPLPIQQKIANGIAQLAQVSEEQHELMQAKPQTAQRQPSATDGKPRPNNTGLPDNLKSGIEALSGMSLDHVKVHYNSAQPAQLNALAYAQGSDIHLAPGQEQHLPHEAWHIVQQAQGRVKPSILMKDGVNINDDSGLEHEADIMGARVVMGNVMHEAQDSTIQLHQLTVNPLSAANTTLGNGRIVNGGNTAQRVLNAMGKKYKVCGKMSAESSASLVRFLAEEEIQNLFYEDDKKILKQKHLDTVMASEEHEKSKGATTGNKLQKLHDELVECATRFSVSPGGDHWDELLDQAAQLIKPQPSGKFIQQNAKEAAEQVWPIPDLGNVPEAFWKQVLKDAKPAYVPKAPNEFPTLVSDVLKHANERFNAWRTGTEKNRGAWAGSASHGEKPDDYEAVSLATLNALASVLPTGGWRIAYSLSADEGNSLHKWGGKAKGEDFIYHL